MRKKLQTAVFLIMFTICIGGGSFTALAEPETQPSGEVGSMIVTQSGNASSDTTLSSLRLAQAKLSPDFDPNQLHYTATVPYEVTRVALAAQTSCPDAKKVISGTGDLRVGENTIVITVTAENGSTREYRIFLTREDAPEGVTESDPAETTENQAQETSEQIETEGTETTTLESEETMPPETIILPTEGDEPASGTETGDHGFIVETDGEDGFDLKTLIHDRKFLMLMLSITCLVSLFVIIAALLLRRDDLEDEDDEDEDDDDEDDDDVKDDVIDDVGENDSPDDEDDDLDDDFELMLEDDDDFDFLDF